MAKQTSKKFSWKKAVLSLAAVGIVAGGATVAKRIIDPRELVTDVIDGDTFTISNKQTIRFYAMDAPEIGNCYGQEAKEALTEKILGKKVIIRSPRTDYYRRVQAYVYLNDEFINEYMVKNGFATEHGEGTPETDIVRVANTFAKENKLGIYSEKCSPSTPKNKICNIKGNVTYNGGKKEYTIPGCRNYIRTIVERFRGEDWFCSEKEAKAAGFAKSSNCP